jgi:hypothetical protein
MQTNPKLLINELMRCEDLDANKQRKNGKNQVAKAMFIRITLHRICLKMLFNQELAF